MRRSKGVKYKNTYKAAKHLFSLLSCDNCDETVARPSTVGGCEHFLCEECVADINDRCPVCGSACDTQDVTHLENLKDMAETVSKIMNLCISDGQQQAATKSFKSSKSMTLKPRGKFDENSKENIEHDSEAGSRSGSRSSSKISLRASKGRTSGVALGENLNVQNEKDSSGRPSDIGSNPGPNKAAEAEAGDGGDGKKPESGAASKRRTSGRPSDIGSNPGPSKAAEAEAGDGGDGKKPVSGAASKRRTSGRSSDIGSNPGPSKAAEAEAGDGGDGKKPESGAASKRRTSGRSSDIGSNPGPSKAAEAEAGDGRDGKKPESGAASKRRTSGRPSDIGSNPVPSKAAEAEAGDGRDGKKPVSGAASKRRTSGRPSDIGSNPVPSKAAEAEARDGGDGKKPESGAASKRRTSGRPSDIGSNSGPSKAAEAEAGDGGDGKKPVSGAASKRRTLGTNRRKPKRSETTDLLETTLKSTSLASSKTSLESSSNLEQDRAAHTELEQLSSRSHSSSKLSLPAPKRRKSVVGSVRDSSGDEADQTLTSRSAAVVLPKLSRHKEEVTEDQTEAATLQSNLRTGARKGDSRAKRGSEKDGGIEDASRPGKSEMNPETDVGASSSDPVSALSTSLDVSSRQRMKRNARGETQLHKAAIHGNTEMAKELISLGIDVNSKDNAGWTPLHEAVNHGRREMARLLLENGAFVNMPGCDNDTPLHDAVENGRLECVRLLVSYGADVEARNSSGKTPRDLAAKRPPMLSALKTKVVVDTSSKFFDKQSREALASGPLVFLVTGLNRSERMMVHKAASLLHADLATEMHAGVTHLICSVSNRGTCPRTLKYLHAVLHGCWIVDYQWAISCIQLKKRAKEEAFEIAGCSTNPKSQAPMRARLNKETKLPGLFNGCKFFFEGSFSYPTPSKEDLASLVKRGGGQVLHREPKGELGDPGDISVPYHASKGSQFENCCFFIVHDSKSSDSKLVVSGLRCFARASWLMNCVASFSLLND